VGIAIAMPITAPYDIVLLSRTGTRLGTLVGVVVAVRRVGAALVLLGAIDDGYGPGNRDDAMDRSC
jgi:hypothetical protein